MKKQEIIHQLEDLGLETRESIKKLKQSHYSNNSRMSAFQIKINEVSDRTNAYYVDNDTRLMKLEHWIGYDYEKSKDEFNTKINELEKKIKQLKSENEHIKLSIDGYVNRFHNNEEEYKRAMKQVSSRLFVLEEDYFLQIENRNLKNRKIVKLIRWLLLKKG